MESYIFKKNPQVHVKNFWESKTWNTFFVFFQGSQSFTLKRSDQPHRHHQNTENLTDIVSEEMQQTLKWINGQNYKFFHVGPIFKVDVIRSSTASMILANIFML